jgi:NADPH-ferrihemoprotein reductase
VAAARAAAAAAGAPPPAVGAAALYFGCRRAGHDFLYREELESFLADGTLTRLRVAFSRAQAEKVYVQHLMAEDAADLREALAEREGYAFVCGDGAAMARDVGAALAAALGGGDAAAGAAALAALAAEGRYVRDVWS